jgi:hypothetical protein
MKKPDNWDTRKTFVNIDQDLPLIDALRINGYVIPGIPEIHVMSAASPFLGLWKKEHLD